jgi:hypothetical protein
MAARTVGMILGSVQRSTGGSVPISDIYEACLDSHRRIYANYPWPWTYKDANILVQPTYSTGTVTVNDGATAVASSGATWSVAWKYKKILFTGVDYQVASFPTTSTATLAQAINTGQNWTTVPYTIYQDVYALPTDCEPADVVEIVNVTIRYRLLHLGRYTLEQRAVATGFTTNNFQDSWCDAGYDDTNNVNLIRLSPVPSAVAEYRIVYRKKVPDITTVSSQTEIPETYDKCLELLTEAEVRRKHRLPGYQEAKQEGYQILQNLRRRVSTAVDDRFAQYATWPTFNNVSMIDYGTGLVIGGPTSAT